MSEKQDLRERCSYLLILFKAKDKVLFEKYSAQLATMSAEESSDFYHSLLAEYKKLVEGPAIKVEQPKKKASKKKVIAKKKPAKKMTKKITKKVKKKAVKKKSKKK